MTYWMDVEAWTEVAYQLSPQEFKVYFCISMMIAQNDGTIVRWRVLAMIPERRSEWTTSANN